MKIHASYFILWALRCIYTSAEDVTAAHVDSWKMNSSWPQNCLGFWLNFSQIFCSCPCYAMHFYMKCAVGILPWPCSAMWVLIPVVTDLWDVFVKFRNILMYCDIAILSPFVTVLLLVPLVCHCWLCPIVPRVFPRKLCNSPKGKWATLLQGFHSAAVLAQPDLCRVITC